MMTSLNVSPNEFSTSRGFVIRTWFYAYNLHIGPCKIIHIVTINSRSDDHLKEIINT